MPLGQTLSSAWTNDPACVSRPAAVIQRVWVKEFTEDILIGFFGLGGGDFFRLKSIPDKRGKVPAVCDGGGK